MPPPYLEKENKKDKINIKIYSDGTPMGTRIVDLDTGERLANVMAASWKITIDGLAEVNLTLRNVPVEITGRVIKNRGVHKRRIELGEEE